MLKYSGEDADSSSAMKNREQVIDDPRVARVGARAASVTPWGRYFSNSACNRLSLAPAERRAANRCERRRAARALREEVEN